MKAVTFPAAAVLDADGEVVVVVAAGAADVNTDVQV